MFSITAFGASLGISGFFVSSICYFVEISDWKYRATGIIIIMAFDALNKIVITFLIGLYSDILWFILMVI